MNYIVFDLEFNQDLTSLQENHNLNWQSDTLAADKKAMSGFPYEIIQIGAVKLDEALKTVGTFDIYIRPAIYKEINPVVSELTGITAAQLKNGEPFPYACRSFLEFIGEREHTLCVWGMSDLKILYKNAEYHNLETGPLPKRYINLQPLVPKFLKLSENKLLRLKTAAELLDIPAADNFHNALSDSVYTALIFKKIYSPSLKANKYEPAEYPRHRQKKKTVHYDRVILQFEKMYDRSLTKEEADMVILSYKMGKTGQFAE